MLSLSDVLIFLAVLAGLLYYYFRRSFKYWKVRNVPCKEPKFLFGHVLDVFLARQYAGKYFANLYEETNAPYFGFYAFAKPFLVLKDLNLIKNVLIKDFHVFPNRSFVTDEKIDPIAANVLPAIKAPQWKALRSKLSPVFTSGKMKMMMYLMKDCGENLKKYLETHLDEEINAKEEAAKFTTDVITSCAFGIDANSFLNEDSEFRVAGRNIFPNSPIRALRAFCFIFAPLLVKMFRFRFIDPPVVAFLSGVFWETIGKREQTKTKRNDLIDILIDLKNQETKDDEYKFDGNRLVAQAIVFFNAGQETSSSVISLTLHELCNNTVIQDRLRKEIQEVLQRHGDLTYEALQDMKYLQMVVSETLRKYPLTPFLQRECAEDYKVKETGLVIEKGVSILIPQFGLHWDPKYFPNPERYDPERFNDENKHKIPSGSYLPFGDGPRNCIGERFGLMSSKLGIIYIINNFKVEKGPRTKEELVFGPSFLLQPKGGVPITLRKLTQ